jgi:hypothetical protein
MRSLNIGPIALNTVTENCKMVGYGCFITVTYTGATDLILYIANGPGLDYTKHSEITVDGVNVTRFTAQSAGIQQISLNGLTPGTFISLQTVSGTGTAVMDFITGSEA